VVSASWFMAGRTTRSTRSWLAASPGIAPASPSISRGGKGALASHGRCMRGRHVERARWHFHELQLPFGGVLRSPCSGIAVGVRTARATSVLRGPLVGSWPRFVTVRPTRMCRWESKPYARRVRPVILGPDLVELICGGVAVLVSTRDCDLQPEIVRAWGPEVSADGSSLTVCVPAAPGSRTAATLESNGEVAALFVSSMDYRAIQVKGRAESLTAPTPEQLQLIEEHVLAFAGRVRELGVNEADIRRVVRPDPVAVRIALRSVYDQTPGRDAGRPL